MFYVPKAAPREFVARPAMPFAEKHSHRGWGFREGEHGQRQSATDGRFEADGANVGRFGRQRQHGHHRDAEPFLDHREDRRHIAYLVLHARLNAGGTIDLPNHWLAATLGHDEGLGSDLAWPYGGSAGQTVRGRDDEEHLVRNQIHGLEAARR